MKRRKLSDPKGKEAKKLVHQAFELLEKRGKKAFEIAKELLLNKEIEYKPIYDVLKYFVQETFYCVQHPGLISLACEAVGGDPDETTLVGVSMVLLAGAVDIHDDIIDQSKIKGSKPTVLGKFGTELALLTGDALLFKGLTTLNKACEKFNPEEREKIMDLIEKAFFELGSAEAKEMDLRGKLNVSPEKYLQIIRSKASIMEMQAEIGAIIGHATRREIETLGKYGRTLGILTTIRDDFIDLFDSGELKNRLRNECLPLPLLYALQNRKIRASILSNLKKDNFTEEDAKAIAHSIWKIREVKSLRENMYKRMNEAIASISFIRKSEMLKEMLIILRATMEDLE